MTRFLFVMDPYASLNLATETSLLMMQSLLKRGVQVFWSEQQDLALRQAQLMVQASAVISVEPFALGEPQWFPVSAFAALVQRKDPPFDERYLHLTYLLDFVPASVKQFNLAASLRNHNEKLSTLRWPQYCPPTLVSQSLEVLAAFIKEHGDVVLKPMAECSGRGLVRIQSGADDWQDVLSVAALDADGRRQTLIAQKFLNEIAQGDKRIYLCNGVVVGLVNRIPRSGGWLGNIHQGAQVEATQLTPREQEIVAAVGPWCVAQGLFLVGMDVIGGYLTELNVTSPSAVRQINAVMGIEVHEKIVAAMLAVI